MKTGRHRWHPFNPLRVRLFSTKPPSQWHHLRREAQTVDNLRLLSQQWPLIIFTGSLVVRMMDALVVVKTMFLFSRSACNAESCEPTQATHSQRLGRSALTQHCRSSTSVVLLKWSHAPPLQYSMAVHGAEDNRPCSCRMPTAGL